MTKFKVIPYKKIPSMYQVVRIGKGGMPTTLTGLYTSPNEAHYQIKKYEEQHNGRKEGSTAGN